MDTNEELIDLPPGGRFFPWIVEDEFDHPLDGRYMISLDLVVVPGLHHLRIGRGNIDLTEF